MQAGNSPPGAATSEFPLLPPQFATLQASKPLNDQELRIIWGNLKANSSGQCYFHCNSAEGFLLKGEKTISAGSGQDITYPFPALCPKEEIYQKTKPKNKQKTTTTKIFSIQVKDMRCRQAGDPLDCFPLWAKEACSQDYSSESTDTEEQQLEEKICP